MMPQNLFLGSLLLALSLLLAPPQPPTVARAQESRMNQSTQSEQPGQPERVGSQFGAPNPKAPAELSHFAFLIGKFRCDAKIKSADGTSQSFQGSWSGRYILDGYAIEDEYRMTGPSGDLVVLGNNYRSYDPAKKMWNIKWLNALAGTWVDLGTPELGGVKIDGPSISYVFKETVAGHAFTRATYTSISKSQFTWRGDQSTDAKTWSDFMFIDCHRTE